MTKQVKKTTQKVLAADGNDDIINSTVEIESGTSHISRTCLRVSVGCANSVIISLINLMGRCAELQAFRILFFVLFQRQ